MIEATEPDQPLRLFFALACPADLAGSICDWRDSLGLTGRPVPSANLHLTLAFLGAQPASRLPALLQMGERLEAKAFELHLDRLGMLGEDFACLFAQQPPTALLQLASELRAALGQLGIACDPRPFRPHLTLLRQAARIAEQAAPAFAWDVRRFGLYLSRSSADGVRYQALASWTLSAAE